MKSSTSFLLSLTLIIFLITPQSVLCWSLNPFKWKKSYDPSLYQEELAKIVNSVEKNYTDLISVIASCEIDLQSNNLIDQFKNIQHKLIEFIQQCQEPKTIVVNCQKDIEQLYQEYPCLAYRKKLVGYVSSLKNKIESYLEHVKEDDHDKSLIEKAYALLLNLVALDELIACSEKFKEEETSCSQRYAMHYKRLTDINSFVNLTQNA